jgi:hypothetical protein
MFVPLTNTGGKQVYMNMALVVWVAPYDGAGEGGPYGPCRSLLLYGQTASQHCLRQCGTKPTVLDQRNPLNVHMLALSL